jgi:Mn2+/Fe2+ NRAMP family transporter
MPDPHPPATTRNPGRGGLWRVLGPGILFAGASIGVSHLVQATRAGAMLGLSLAVVVVLAHLVKFPGLSFGCRYAAATGRSLIDAYRAQGRHAIGTLWVITLGTMFAIVSAILLVTAATVQVALVPVYGWIGWAPPLWGMAAVTGLATTAIIALGGFRWLDRVMKALMVLMLVLTLTAAGLELPELLRADWGDGTGRPWPTWGMLAANTAFIVALVGWMPAPMDISVWNSLWTLERAKQTGYTGTRREVSLDFLIGFGLTIVLALAFLTLGAALMHNRGVDIADGGPGFIAQVIELYTQSLGGWVRPIIALGAVAVMFSTLLTVIDAIPRVLMSMVKKKTSSRETIGRTWVYWLAHAGLLITAVLVVAQFTANLTLLVDIATTLSFLSTPVLAWFNHRAMFRTANGKTGVPGCVPGCVPLEHRPGRGMWLWSWSSIVLLTAFAAWFVWTKLPV